MSIRPLTLPLAAFAWLLIGWLGLSDAVPGGIVWAQTGLGLALVMRLGRRVWPAILSAAFLLHLIDGSEWLPAAALAATDLAQVLAAAALVDRRAGRGTWFTTDWTLRATGVAIVVTAGTAIISTVVLVSSSAIRADAFVVTWVARWTGHLAGMLIVAPVVLLASRESARLTEGETSRELVAMLTTTSAVGLVVFSALAPSGPLAAPLQLLCVPVLLWAAFRFDRSEAMLAVALLFVGAAWGTANGHGPFAGSDGRLSMISLHTPMLVLAAMTAAISASVADRRQAEARLEQLATSDSLTGLANYRRLLDVLRAEISRSRRTKRPFALVFLDVDGLKAINDRYGHVVGNRSLCRVAETLTRSCRAIDTPARFGGDEFAVVLPESGIDGGVRVSERVAGALAGEASPEVRVTTGTSVFPNDGDSPTMLMRAADQALSRAKARRDPRVEVSEPGEPAANTAPPSPTEAAG